MSVSSPPVLVLQHTSLSRSLALPEQRQHPPPQRTRLRPLSAPSFSPLTSPFPARPNVARIAALARLASQHHTSEYNLAKHGPSSPDPAPVYVPLSFRRPDRVLQLQERQAQADAREWHFPAVPSSSPQLQPDRRPTLLSRQNSAPDPPHAFPRAPPPSSEGERVEGRLESFAALALERPPLVHSPRVRSPHPHARRAGQACTGGCCKPLPGLPPSVKTSESHPISTSILIPKHLMPLVASHISVPHSPAAYTYPSSGAPSCLYPLQLPARLQLLHLLQTTRLPPPGTVIPPTGCGNLLLSSCPGKKVRLSGGSDSRGAISRDLDTDLARMKDAGVGCVICCLDDLELALLGVPFPAYQRTLAHLGLSLVRIPICEGLAPLSPELLFERLELVLRENTAKGVDVVVHCRGGVGRAGVVAGAWTLMLGLVPVPPARSYSGTAPWANEWEQEEEEEELDCVREVVHLLRLRRSSKAIETYEQVAFLAEFVRFLRDRPGRHLGL